MEHERALKQKKTENDQLKKRLSEESKVIALPKAVVPKNRRGAIKAGFPVKLSSQVRGCGVDRIGLNYTDSDGIGGWWAETEDEN